MPVSRRSTWGAGCQHFFHLVSQVRRNQTGGPLREKNTLRFPKVGLELLSQLGLDARGSNTRARLCREQAFTAVLISNIDGRSPLVSMQTCLLNSRDKRSASAQAETIRRKAASGNGSPKNTGSTR